MGNHCVQDSLRQRVYDFVLGHPGQDSHTVAEQLAITAHKAGSELSTLARKGRIFGKRTKGSRLSTWFVCDDDEALPEAPCCTVKTEWAPVKIPPQGIFAALGL